MRIKELIIKDMAFAIHADMKCKLSPKSDRAAIAWLELALAWAIRHNRRELAKIITEYLNDETEPDAAQAEALAAV